MKWHFQFSPNDPYDYDSVAEMVLADLTIGGKPTKALMDVNRNGFIYVLDRTDGKLIAANPYITKQLGEGHRLRADGRSRPKSPTRCGRGRKSTSGRRWAARTGARSRSIRKPAWSMPTR